MKPWLDKLLRLFQNEFKGQLWQKAEAAVVGKSKTNVGVAHGAYDVRWLRMLMDNQRFRLPVTDADMEFLWRRVEVGAVMPVMYRVSRFDSNKREWKLDLERITFKLVVKR